ncbi:MAG: multidrug effflux MFS transporter [Rhodocyclaceae bacterium]|nr:multidrug effflux MFS transporter [Rhodocyclaceae bacterium]
MSPTILLWLITGCLMLQPLSTDLNLASLPHLAAYFAVTPAAVQQTLSLFVIGFGTAQLVGGPLSDRYGRRPVLLGGLAIYTLSSIACGLAPSLAVLVAARFVQAVGCCTAVVVARAIIRDAYAPAEGAHMIARASMLLSFAPLLGPIAGGYLQVAFGWRAAFALLTVLCLVLTAASLRWLEETNGAPDPSAMRLRGLLDSYRRIARSPAFWAYTLPGALSYASIFVFISGSSFVLIEVLGMPTQYYGYCYAFGVSGYLTGTLVCRRLLRRIGVDRALGVGTTLALLAGLLFAALVAAGVRHWALVPLCQFLTMAAHGINFPCAQSGAVAPFPQQAGAAAGLLGFVTMISALLAGIWVGASHDGTLHPLAWIAATVSVCLFAAARLSAHRREFASA